MCQNVLNNDENIGKPTPAPVMKNKLGRVKINIGPVQVRIRHQSKFRE